MYFDAYRIKIPIIAAQGELDTIVLPQESIIMTEKINEAGGNAKLILHSDVDHSVWHRIFTDKTTYEWLLDKHREKRKGRFFNNYLIRLI